MFSGKRFVTSGIAEKVPLLLQVIMWDMIDTMDENNRNTRRSICLKQVLLFCVQRFLS